MIPGEQRDIDCCRVGRGPDPLEFAPLQVQAWDGRYDDPDRVSRTLYFADSAYGAWVEVLARFRPEPAVRDALEYITAEDGDTEPSTGVQLGWLTTRRVAFARISGRTVDVTHTTTLSWLDRQLRDELAARALDQLDLSVATGHDRALTQQIARNLRLHADAEVLSYTSRHGDDITCYAVFEGGTTGGADIAEQDTHGVDLDSHNEALSRALKLHDLPYAE